MSALRDQACSQLNDTGDDTDIATKTLLCPSLPSNAATTSKEKGKKESCNFRSEKKPKVLNSFTTFIFSLVFFFFFLISSKLGTLRQAQGK